MRNVFKSLSRWFASSTEDFFTASLALFIERNERFRDEFLDWLTPLVTDDLHKRNWTVSAQVWRPSCMGGAVLDMVLSSPDLELWFEHKVGSQLGKYGEKDQIEKYLDTANRVMLGIEDGEMPVAWPEKGPEKGYPRVVLFYIGRGPKPLDAERYSGRAYEASRPYGIVARTLRWRELWPKANRALADALHGEWGEFEKTLSMQFIGYWRSIPGMWTAAYAGGDIDMTKLPKLPKLSPRKTTPKGIITPKAPKATVVRIKGRWLQVSGSKGADFLPGGYRTSRLVFREDGILEVRRAFDKEGNVSVTWCVGYKWNKDGSMVTIGGDEADRPLKSSLKGFEIEDSDAKALDAVDDLPVILKCTRLVLCHI